MRSFPKERLKVRLGMIGRPHLRSEAGWAFLGLAAQLVGQALTLKLVTALLTRTDYGFVALANSGSMFFQMIFLASILQGMGRLVPMSQTAGTIDSLVRTTAGTANLVLAPLGGAALFASVWIALSGNAEVAILLLTATAMTYADYRAARTQYLALAARRRHFLASHRAADALMRAVFVTGALLIWRDAVIVPLAFAIASLSVNSLFEPRLLRSLGGPTPTSGRSASTRDQRRMLIGFAAPLAIASAMTWGQTSADRWILTRFVSLEDVGTYAAAMQVGGLPFAVLASFFSLFAQPILYRRADSGHRDVPTWILIEAIAYAALAGAGLLAIECQTERLVHIFLGEPQWGCAPLVPLIAAASAVFRWSEIFLVGILVSGRTSLLIGPNLAGGLGAILGNIILLPRVGVTGAAWALGASSTLRLVALVFANRKAWRGWQSGHRDSAT